MTFFFFQVHSNAIHSFDHRSLYINTINPMRTNRERKHFESLDIASSFSDLQAKVDGRATEVDQPALCTEVNVQHRSPPLVGTGNKGQLTKVLSVQQTGCWVHVAPVPVPMAVIGLQPSPRRPSIVGRAIPSSPLK